METTKTNTGPHKQTAPVVGSTLAAVTDDMVTTTVYRASKLRGADIDNDQGEKKGVPMIDIAQHHSSCFYTLLLVFLCASFLGGCGTGANPGFSMEPDEAELQLAQHAQEQPSLERPLLLLSGYADPGLAPEFLTTQFSDIFAEDRMIGMNFYTALTMDECRERVIERTHSAFPSTDPNQTVLVDVIAHSMGGLVSRYAAMDIPGKPRLRIARLFTIATPHQGALISIAPSLDLRVEAMRAGSDFLQTLDDAFSKRDYEMICYTRLGDVIVAPKAAAPPDYPLWWVPNLPLTASHLDAPGDPRILLDIVRRLRNQKPITVEPAPPLPE